MAIGFFDGLHHGHRKVIQTGLEEGKAKKSTTSGHEFFSTSENCDLKWKKTNSLFHAAN